MWYLINPYFRNQLGLVTTINVQQSVLPLRRILINNNLSLIPLSWTPKDTVLVSRTCEAHD